MSGWDQQGDIEDMNQRLHQRGLWGMTCFNGLSQEQQVMVVEGGVLPFGQVPAGECLRGAEVEVFTDRDRFPGPRFYCRRCAIDYLSAQEVSG